jgi:hypothetical protein
MRTGRMPGPKWGDMKQQARSRPACGRHQGPCGQAFKHFGTAAWERPCAHVCVQRRTEFTYTHIRISICGFMHMCGCCPISLCLKARNTMLSILVASLQFTPPCLHASSPPRLTHSALQLPGAARPDRHILGRGVLHRPRLRQGGRRVRLLAHTHEPGPSMPRMRQRAPSQSAAVRNSFQLW